MKKITLLFIMLCAGQLYGMEEQSPYESLLPEIKKEIIQTALATSNDIYEAINSIRATSAFYNVPYATLFNNIEDFTQLVHMLADKFKLTTVDIADEFDTPMSEEYKGLIFATITGSLDATDELTQLITKGLDVNATARNNQSLLMVTIVQGKKSEIVQLLLDAGANPYHKNDEGKTALDIKGASEEIKQILKAAMNQ